MGAQNAVTTGIEHWIARILTLPKIPNQLVSLIALFTAIILFSPASWVNFVHLQALNSKYACYVGIGFLVSVLLLAVRIVSAIWRSQRKRSSQAAFQKYLHRQLHALDAAQQAVLREYAVQETETLKLPINDPAVARLVEIGTLQRVGQVAEKSRVGLLCALRISDTARKIIKASPATMGLSHYVASASSNTSWELSDDGWQFCFHNRPVFITQLLRERALLDLL